MTDAKSALAAAKRRLGDLAATAPAAMRAMTELTRATGTAGALTPAQKELVAVAIAVT
jgi:hypothetical protein